MLTYSSEYNSVTYSCDCYFGVISVSEIIMIMKQKRECPCSFLFRSLIICLAPNITVISNNELPGYPSFCLWYQWEHSGLLVYLKLNHHVPFQSLWEISFFILRIIMTLGSNACFDRHNFWVVQ